MSKDRLLSLAFERFRLGIAFCLGLAVLSVPKNARADAEVIAIIVGGVVTVTAIIAVAVCKNGCGGDVGDIVDSETKKSSLKAQMQRSIRLVHRSRTRRQKGRVRTKGRERAFVQMPDLKAPYSLRKGVSVGAQPTFRVGGQFDGVVFTTQLRF